MRMAGARVRALLLFAALAGCQEDVARPVQPLTLVAVRQRRTVDVATRADILFVVDDSPSMSGKIQRMTRAFGGFITALDALDPAVDYHLAVTTTSVGERFGSCAPANGLPSATCSSDWYATGFICDVGGACWRPFDDRAGALHAAPGATPILKRGQMPPDQLAATFGQALQVPLDGARQTRAFEALEAAVRRNPDLMRPGAKLVPIFLTDGDDCSDPDHRTVGLTRAGADGHLVDNCVVEAAKDDSSSLLMPLATFETWLGGLEDPGGARHEVVFAGVVDLAPSGVPGVCHSTTCERACDTPDAAQACAQQCGSAADPAQCARDCNAQCHAWCSGEQPSVRYARLLASVDGVAASICDDSYANALAQVARVIGVPTAVTLSAAPAPDTSLLVQVVRGDAVITCAPGIDYVRSGSEISLVPGGACRLQPGDTYDVRYLTTP